MPKTKLTPERRKANKAASQKAWRDSNKERIKSYNAGYYLTHTVKKRQAYKLMPKEVIKGEKATPAELKRLSGAILYDRNEAGLTLAQLADKYLTNRRAIGRILNPKCK